MQDEINPIPFIVTAVVAFIGIILIIWSVVIVDTTERVVITEFGKVERILEPGFHFINPITESSKQYRISTNKVEVAATAASKDLQDVTTTVAVQYNIDPAGVGDIYAEYRGNSLQTSVIDPAIQDAIKAGTAAFNAEALITQRPAVKAAIEDALRERLAEAFVRVSNVDIIDFTFSASFNEAIEEKVKAEQRALTAENDLARVEFESQQRVVQAEAEAEAIRIQAAAVDSQGGEDYVNLKAIEKWNGQLPTQFVPGSAVPFINL